MYSIRAGSQTTPPNSQLLPMLIPSSSYDNGGVTKALLQRTFVNSQSELLFTTAEDRLNNEKCLYIGQSLPHFNR